MPDQTSLRPRSLPDVTRRTFLKGSAGSVAAMVVLSAHALDAEAQENPALTGLQFFNTDQAATVDALAEQFWPTTPESPGAITAGAMIYIDRALAGAYADQQGIYRAGLTMLNDTMLAERGDVFTDLDPAVQLEVLVGLLDDASAPATTGTPAAGTPAAATPIAATPQVDTAAEGRPLGGATPAAIDTTTEGVPIIAGLGGPQVMELTDFLDIVKTHTMEGMFADPVYGGNRDFAGWAAVGYPGPYYIYTEEQQQSFAPLNQPFQSVADL